MNILRASVTGLCVLLCLVFATNARAQTYQHNIQALLINPTDSQHIRAGTPLSIWFKNTGKFTERKISFIGELIDLKDSLLQQDTGIIDSIRSGDSIACGFNYWTYRPFSTYRYIAYCVLDGDEFHPDDTLKSTFKISPVDQAVASELLIPRPNESLPEKIGFYPTATFKDYGLTNVFDVQAGVEIRRCSDNSIAFRADSAIPALYVDDTAIPFTFPSYNKDYNIRALTPGCYTIMAFAHHPQDPNRTDDTIRATFSIIPHQVQDDIGVDSIYHPSMHYVQVNSVIPIKVRFKNFGLASEQPSVVYGIVQDRHGKILYIDSSAIPGLLPGEEKVVEFKPYSATAMGQCYIIASIIAPKDDFPENNTLQDTLRVGLPNDVRAVEILEPSQNAIEYLRVSFEPKVILTWQGLTSVSPLTHARIEIRSCTNNELIYSDTAEAILSYRKEIDTILFKGRNGALSTFGLSTGCYKMLAISEMPGDLNRSNDTVQSTFSVRGLYDLSADSILSPNTTIKYLNNAVIPFTAKFTNRESTAELKYIYTRILVKDEKKTLIFSVDSIIDLWHPNEIKEITFTSAALPYSGFYTVEAISLGLSDSVHSNDTIRERFYYGENLAVTQTPNASITLGQNFPNPATQKTTISYTLPKNGYVSLRLQDVLGRTTRIFTNGRFEQAGSHAETFTLDGIPTGSYTYSLSFCDVHGNTTILAHQLGIIKSSY